MLGRRSPTLDAAIQLGLAGFVTWLAIEEGTMAAVALFAFVVGFQTLIGMRTPHPEERTT